MSPRCPRVEWLRFIEEDRERKPSTLRDYRSALNARLLPAFGGEPIEAISTEPEPEPAVAMCQVEGLLLISARRSQ